MNQDKDDSDYEMCLTSSQYNRILNIEKQCRREQESFNTIKKQLQNEITSLKKNVSTLQSTLKTKVNQVDQLNVECLRLKKLRLVNEEEIKNLKQSQAIFKEQNDEMIQQSMRQSTLLKDKMVQEESKLSELRSEIDKCRSENISLVQRFVTQTKQFEISQFQLTEKVKVLEKQHSDIQKRSAYFQKKSQDLQTQLADMKQKYKSLTEQKEKLAMINEQSAIKFKEDLQHNENIKKSIQTQLRIVKEQQQELINSKNQQVAKLNAQAQKMNQLLIEANKKIQGFGKSEKKQEQPQKSSDYQKFSSRIYQALQWTKEGILQPQQLKQQIDNIMTFQKQYQDIINKNNKKIKQLQSKIKILEAVQKQQIIDYLQQKDHKLKKQQSQVIIMVLKQQMQKAKLKLARTTDQYDDAFQTYNNNINELQEKYDNVSDHLRQAQNQIEALKLSHQYYKIEIKQALELFSSQLERMKSKSLYLNEQEVMKTLYGLLPKFEK